MLKKQTKNLSNTKILEIIIVYSISIQKTALESHKFSKHIYLIMYILNNTYFSL